MRRGAPGDGVDGDCDGQEDCYDDADLDGFGEGVVHTADLTCGPPSAVGRPLGDDATRYPGAPEIVADGVDQDCDGTDLCWVDGDGDAFGGALQATALDCTAAGLALVGGTATRCRRDRGPGLPETACDGIDPDCSPDRSGCAPDEDLATEAGDGPQTLCDPYGITDDTDCDDADARTPGERDRVRRDRPGLLGSGPVVAGHADRRPRRLRRPVRRRHLRPRGG